MGKKKNDEEGSCDAEGLSEDDCVNKKIGVFCKYLKDKPYCKQQFEKLKNGEITAEQLAENLRAKFSEKQIAEAKKNAQRDLGE